MQKTDHEVLVLIRTALPHRYRGIARLAGERGWIMRMESRRMPPKDWNGDGVIVMLEDFPDLKKFVARMGKRKIPVVDIIDFVSNDDVFRVSRDNYEIGRMAARFFNKKRFRNAAYFSQMRTRTHDMVLAGFGDVWKGGKPGVWIWPDEKAKVEDRFTNMDDWLENLLKSAPKPLALFTWNDFDAMCAIERCASAGVKVPEEVAVLGVDNDKEICESTSPAISSIDPNYFRVGYMGAATLERLMSGGRAPRKVVRIKPAGVVERGSTKTNAVTAEEIKPAIDYIMKNLGRQFGPAEVAAALGMHRLKFDRMFARVLGHSAGTEISERKLVMAEHLMESSDMSIGEIAKRCGYCSSTFFIRMFKKSRGMSPAEWRKSIRQA